MAVYSSKTETNSQTFKPLKYSVSLTAVSSSYTLFNCQHPLGTTATCSIGTKLTYPNYKASYRRWRSLHGDFTVQ